MTEHGTYRCGAYLRLSREDGEGESNSIAGQRLLVKKYIAQNSDLIYCREWVDDGYSGIRFDRPGFQQMMQAVLHGEIDCIVVKDLSRLGREYILTGMYLQKIFPSLGIRFISVTDCYDSNVANGMDLYLFLPIRSIMNDAYCMDISRKVRASLQAKRMAGEYIGAFAVYGYEKMEKDFHRLVKDSFAAKVVFAIFGLYCSGCSAESITEALNKKAIVAPGYYKRQQGLAFRSGFASHFSSKWSSVAVRRILHNETYTGVLLQGKSRKLNYKSATRVTVPSSEWCRNEENMEPIIPKWCYDRVEWIFQKGIRKKRKSGLFDFWYLYIDDLEKMKLSVPIRVYKSIVSLIVSSFWKEYKKDYFIKIEAKTPAFSTDVQENMLLLFSIRRFVLNDVVVDLYVNFSEQLDERNN